MLSATEVEVLEQLLENDRLQKQLLQELFTAVLDDEYGIPYEAYNILCELGDQIGLVFEGIYRVGVCEGRAYLKEAEPEEEEIPEEIEPDTFSFDVVYEYTSDACWEWAEEQSIATIKDIVFIPSPQTDVTHMAGQIRIMFHFDEQNTIENRTKLAHDFKIKAVAGK